jgi:hypothetical protein
MGSSKETPEDQDVAELRRNLATGNQKDTGDASSASESRLFNASNATCSIAVVCSPFCFMLLSSVNHDDSCEQGTTQYLSSFSIS